VSDPIKPDEFLRRKAPDRSNKEYRSYTYAEVLSLLAEYGSECVLAEFERRGDIPTEPPHFGDVGAQVPIQKFGTHGAIWFCKCKKRCSSNATNVDVHCSCGRVWRKKDLVVTLQKDLGNVTGRSTSVPSETEPAWRGPHSETRRRRNEE
jgi:hypothetical protein